MCVFCASLTVHVCGVCLCVFRLRENYELLRSRLCSIMDSKHGLEEDIKQQAARNRNYVADMNALKPEIKRLYKAREQLKK